VIGDWFLVGGSSLAVYCCSAAFRVLGAWWLVLSGG